MQLSQFIDLNDACTIEYKSQKQLTTIDKFFCKASQKNVCLVHVSVQQFTLVCVFVYMYFFLNCVHVFAFNNVNLCILKHIK